MLKQQANASSQELSGEILVNPDDVERVAAMEESGQHIAGLIMGQGQLVRLYARALSF